MTRTAFDLTERDLAIKTCADVEALVRRIEKVECRLDKMSVLPEPTSMVDHKVLEARMSMVERSLSRSEGQREDIRKNMNTMYSLVTIGLAALTVLVIYLRG